MTTTSTYSGMKEDAKPSSRVLRPPGGGSSDIFGQGEPKPAAAKPKPSAAKPTDQGVFKPASDDSEKLAAAQRSARDGDNSFSHLFGESASPALGQKSASQRVSTHDKIFGADKEEGGSSSPGPSASNHSGTTHAHIFGDDAATKPSAQGGGGASGRYSGKGRGSYNPITGADYKDLAPNHHALHIKEPPKPQKEQPPLPCSDGVYQTREGKMQEVQTSTRITNPPGGKTHKLW